MSRFWSTSSSLRTYLLSAPVAHTLWPLLPRQRRTACSLVLPMQSSMPNSPHQNNFTHATSRCSTTKAGSSPRPRSRMAVVHNLGGAGLLPAPSATGTCWRSDDAAAARHGVDEASGPVKLAFSSQLLPL